jgi:hypothetical protein
VKYSLIEDEVRVDLHDETNEGWNGDYNADDPTDELLLRFDISYQGEPVDNASYCTQIPANISDQQANQVLRLIMQEVKSSVIGGVSIKKKCEYLSWISTPPLR